MAGKSKKKVGEDETSKDNYRETQEMKDNVETEEQTDEMVSEEDEEMAEPQLSADTAIPNEPSDAENQPGEEPEEIWDMTEVLYGKHNITCRMENCNAKAVSVWKSNLETDVWPMCEPCVLGDFGGFPIGTVLPAETDSLSPEKKKLYPQDRTKEATTGTTGLENNSDTEEPDETWDLKKVYSEKELSDPCPIKCSHGNCKLQAAVLYVSSATGQKWHSCLDCQVDDYEGWPELHEIPIDYMSDEHKQLMLSKCSKFKNTEMPVFPGTSPMKSTTTHGNTVTPVPNNSTLKLQKDPNGDGAVITPIENSKKNNKKEKPSKQSLQMHAKWREDAIAAGGPDAQIVLKHPAAKKLIYDYLYDSFRPQTINQIYQGLKCAVPSPVLRACLDAMALDDASEQFIDSDDEDSGSNKKKKAKTDAADENELGNVLCFKAGRGNNSLYYVDYNKAKNGNGLEGDEKNELLSNVAKANARLENLKHSLKTMIATTTQLLSEPLNEQATTLLQKGEAEMADLNEQLESARKLVVNEKHKQDLKRRIDKMATIWRQRKRLCMEFLVNLEENTDGSITAKKCFKGDGPKGLELESDEAVTSAAVEYHKNKKSKNLGGKKRLISSKSAQPKGIQPTESFVAVQLTSQGQVERIYADDDAK